MNSNEIHLQKLWIVMKSRGGQRTRYSAVWVDQTIVQTLLDSGEIADVDSIRFCQYPGEATKRWV